MKKLKILSVFGTRPCAIKMAPVVHHLSQIDSIEHRSCSTGQHQHLLNELLPFLGIYPDYELSVMKPDQSMPEIIAAVITGMKDVLQDFRPDWLLVHGDTSTCLAASLAAFYEKIKIGHIEAGLRTHTRTSPFPEEANRFMTDFLATLHFAPTSRNALNLLREGVRPKSIAITGNTIEEALHETLKNTITFSDAVPDKVREIFQAEGKIVLVTCHRRENQGHNLHSLCLALLQIVRTFPSIRVCFPIHPSPVIGEQVYSMLGGHDRIILSAPLLYPDFILALRKSWAVITDSGGVQEECVFLKKKALILREHTERPEWIPPGRIKMIDIKPEVITAQIGLLLESVEEIRPKRPRRQQMTHSPSRKIAEKLLAFNPNPLRLP